MTDIDPRSASLQTALARRLEVDFKLGGASVTLRPHILYVDRNGVLKVAGQMGDIPVTRIPVLQIRELMVSPRDFQPDPAFDFGDPEYDHPISTVTGV